jgi:hypothetical protein
MAVTKLSILLSLLTGDSPRWVITFNLAGLPTLSSSIWRTAGCRSHFFRRDGSILCRSSKRRKRPFEDALRKIMSRLRGKVRSGTKSRIMRDQPRGFSCHGHVTARRRTIKRISCERFRAHIINQLALVATNRDTSKRLRFRFSDNVALSFANGLQGFRSVQPLRDRGRFRHLNAVTASPSAPTGSRNFLNRDIALCYSLQGDGGGWLAPDVAGRSLATSVIFFPRRKNTHL